MLATKIKIAFIAMLAIVMPASTLTFYSYVGASVVDPNLDYAVVVAPPILQLASGERRMVEVSIQNVSGITWDKEFVGLATSYPAGELDRPSVWRGEGWRDEAWIPMVNTENVMPGRKATFKFELVAPEYAGWYKERFRLAVETQGPLSGSPIELTIQVGDQAFVQAGSMKEIRIYRSTQQSDLVENGYVVATLDISSGKAGYTTPVGRYRIMNQIPEAYSQRYKLYMSNWMGLIKEGGGYEGYGLHSLAYWKTVRPLHPDGTILNGRLYVGNRVYEDVIHLGKPMSHGCVRYGIDESGVLFQWAEVGMPVTVI